MLYVGKNWKGSGHLLLIGLCAYCAIFVTYSWSKQAKTTYESFYRPVLALLPPVKYVDNKFKFDAEMPVEIKHPISEKKAIYIDTTTDEIPEKAWKYRVIITKDRFITSDLPGIFESHWFYHSLIFPFQESPIENENFTSISEKLIKAGDEASSNSHFGVYIITSIWLIILESCKTLLITLIVMFMFNNGGMIRKTKKDFKMVSRLCILTYLPVLLSNSLYNFLMTTPGIFMIIFLSFIHIILLMTAIHLNRMEEEPPSATQ